MGTRSLRSVRYLLIFTEPVPRGVVGMVPELIAAEARRRGWDRQEARRKLVVDFPMLTVAEIDEVLDTVYGHQSGQFVGGGVQCAETF